jgi:antitoxin YefM
MTKRLTMNWESLDVRYNVRYNTCEVIEMSEINQINLSNARKNIYRLVDEINETHVPYLLTGKKNKAVLISMEDWNAIQETLYLQGIPGMTDSIKAADAEPLSESTKLKDVKW